MSKNLLDPTAQASTRPIPVTGRVTTMSQGLPAHLEGGYKIKPRVDSGPEVEGRQNQLDHVGVLSFRSDPPGSYLRKLLDNAAWRTRTTLMTRLKRLASSLHISAKFRVRPITLSIVKGF